MVLFSLFMGTLIAALSPSQSSAAGVMCKVLQFQHAIRCNCPTTLVACTDGRKGYVHNKAVKEVVPGFGRHDPGAVRFFAPKDLKVFETRSDEHLNKILKAPHCRYYAFDGKPIYDQGEGAITVSASYINGSKYPRSCFTSATGNHIEWPRFCAGMIACGDEPPQLTVCPANGVGAFACVAADSCVKAQKENVKETTKSEIRIRVVKNDRPIKYRSHEFLGETRLVSWSEKSITANTEQRSICVGQVKDPQGAYSLGTGPLGKDGTCRIQNVVEDQCIRSEMHDSKVDLTPYPHEVPRSTPQNLSGSSSQGAN